MSRDIVWISTDQQRLDHAGFAPGARIATPQIDRIAEGAALTRCTSVDPVCAPARAAMLTGKYAHQVGMSAMAGDLALEHPTFPRALREAGYWSAHVGKTHWLQGWSFDWRRTPRGGGHDLVALNDEIKRYGFDHLVNVSGKELAVREYGAWADHLRAHGLLEAYRDYVQSFSRIDMARGVMPEVTAWPFDERHHVDVWTAQKAIEAMDAAPRGRPMFLHCAFCGPHKPLDPPEEILDAVDAETIDDAVAGEAPDDPDWRERLRAWRRGYAAQVKLIDREVGRVLDALDARGRLEEAVIVFWSDHGEMLGDHGAEGKARPYAGASRVPAAIRHPDHLGAGPIETPVELTDLTATTLDVAGLDPQQALSKPHPAFHDRVPSRSLLPLLRGEATRVRPAAFSECGAGWRMVEEDAFKYVHRPAEEEGADVEELYALAEDPEETRNVAADPRHAAALERCRRRLRHVLDRTPTAQLRWAPFGAEDIAHELPTRSAR